MPILDVELFGTPNAYPRDLAQRIADYAGNALESRAHGTWVKIRFLCKNTYAENGGMNEGDNPVIVSVIQANPPSGDSLREQAKALTNAIAEATAHSSENVHLVFEAPAKGRIAFGGELVE